MVSQAFIRYISMQSFAGHSPLNARYPYNGFITQLSAWLKCIWSLAILSVGTLLHRSINCCCFGMWSQWLAKARSSCGQRSVMIIIDFWWKRVAISSSLCGKNHGSSAITAFTFSQIAEVPRAVIPPKDQPINTILEDNVTFLHSGKSLVSIYGS